MDKLFITMAHLVAMQSKDTSTTNGAVIVDSGNVISTGFNSFPDNVKDTKERRQRPEKYFYTEHAERNAIYKAKRDLTGCTLYTTWIPCADCARAIIQSGIKEVVYHKDFNEFSISGDWNDSNIASHNMLIESGVILREYEGKLLNIKTITNGKEFIYNEGNNN